MGENKDKRIRSVKTRKEKKNEVDTFIERPIPREEEVEYFDKAVKSQAWRGDIERNLQAIYEDRDGKMIDVKRIKKRRPRIFVLRIFKWLLTLFVLGIAAYLSYQYFLNSSKNSDALDVSMEAPSEMQSNEDFSYQVKYRNLTRQPIKNIRVEVVLPDNFVIESSSSASSSPGIYQVDNLNPKGSGILEIKGRIINGDGSVNVASSKVRYTVGDFSSEFMKEAGINTTIKGVGLSASLDYSDTVLSGSDQSVSLSIANVTRDDLGQLKVSINLPQGAEFSGSSQAQLEAPDGLGVKLDKASESSWVLSGLQKGEDEIKISWHYVADNIDKGDIGVSIEEADSNGAYHSIWEKQAPFEVIKSDLSLILIANGSKSDNSINFGDRIYYTLSYENHGSSTLKDVILVASVKGEFVDWNTLKSDIAGSVTGNAILWDKTSYPALSQIEPGDSGEINFSIGTSQFDESGLANDPTIISYAQFKLSDSGSIGDEHNRSNTIKTSLNSDFGLTEKILYFDENNIPVGFGPLPPQVGQKTGFKVMWTVKNNLHELRDAKVVMNLPSYMNFEGNQKNSVGSVYYDENNRQVVWDIGRLPISVYRADAEFSISISPTESDRNKILVISSGSQASATDSVTGAVLTRKASAKTTKLEDDDIAGLSNSGIVN